MTGRPGSFLVVQGVTSAGTLDISMNFSSAPGDGRALPQVKVKPLYRRTLLENLGNGLDRAYVHTDRMRRRAECRVSMHQGPLVRKSESADFCAVVDASMGTKHHPHDDSDNIPTSLLSPVRLATAPGLVRSSVGSGFAPMS